MTPKPPDIPASRSAVIRHLVGNLPAVGAMLCDQIRSRSPDRTGDLDRSYTYEVDEREAVVRVGTELEYGKYIELGTVRMSPRAPIRRTLAEESDRILAALGAEQGGY